ncbi:YchJ family protein [Marinobacteraceae bacterium S3BR75-40.1]
MTDDFSCPCGSELPYSQCCQPYHSGKPAPTPEALMRSRYSAFCLELTDYINATWHPYFRPAGLTLSDGDQWKRLQIMGASQNGNAGRVHFKATYKTDQTWGVLEEISDFVLEEGQWLYTQGQTRMESWAPGRNDSCPCGSGRKYKKCCLNK